MLAKEKAYIWEYLTKFLNAPLTSVQEKKISEAGQHENETEKKKNKSRKKSVQEKMFKDVNQTKDKTKANRTTAR